MNRRALMLAYFFPPNTTGGVLRTVKFCKYLQDFGWHTSIIAPFWDVKPHNDVSFGKDLPAEVEVVRSGVGDKSSWLWDSLDAVPYFWRWSRKLRAGLQYPDVYSYWCKDALPTARHLVQTGQHDLIYSTSPPVSSHYVALKLKAEVGLPWVADFRDPWTDNVLGYLNPFQWRKRLDTQLEQDVVLHADKVIANTETNRKTLLEKYDLTPEKVVTIHNGYDEADFRDCNVPHRTERFRITYSGTLYSHQDAKLLLVALREFLSQERDPQVVLSLAGSCCEAAAVHIEDALLEKHVELHGYLPHLYLCQLLMESDLLLHMYPPGVPYSVPSKLFEYLRSGRPILAFCDRPSEVASILDRTNRGRAFRQSEVNAFVNHLREMYAEWCTGKTPGPKAPDENIRIYDRRVLAERLAEVFEDITAEATTQATR